jgi:hypothetical protein
LQQEILVKKRGQKSLFSLKRAEMGQVSTFDFGWDTCAAAAVAAFVVVDAVVAALA